MSLLVITSAVVLWNTFYVILHLYRTLVWSKALFKESILFLAESRSVPQFGPHRLFFGKEILAIILFSESFSSDTEPEKWSISHEMKSQKMWFFWPFVPCIWPTVLITLFFILTPVCVVFKYYTWFKFSLRSVLALSVRKNRILFFFI